MRLAMICFSLSGYEQMKKISAALHEKARNSEKEEVVKAERELNLKSDSDSAESLIPEEYVKCRAVEENLGIPSLAESTEEWAVRQFADRKALLFIGAAGIAVRAIASSVKSKLTDSPVLVMDDCGRYIIPLLSGHVGGANELAFLLADRIGAEPVITTATDRHGCFAVDLFAKRNHLQIMNKAGIARVSSGVLAGKGIVLEILNDDGEKTVFRMDSGKFQKSEAMIPDVRISPDPPEEWNTEKKESEKEPERDVWDFDRPLWLRPRAYVLGIGCKRGKNAEELRAVAEHALTAAGLNWADIYAIASLDLKADEEGLCRLAEELRIPFLTYSAGVLQKAEGQFSESSFVKQTTGVGCVCERAAVVCCGAGGQLILGKQAKDGVTCALAKRKWSIDFNET